MVSSIDTPNSYACARLAKSFLRARRLARASCLRTSRCLRSSWRNSRKRPPAPWLTLLLSWGLWFPGGSNHESRVSSG